MSDRRHPWELQRFEAYRRILADHRALGGRRVLDVGSGDAWFGESLLAYLPADAAIVCWDANYDDDELDVGPARLTRTRDRPEPGFDLVLALDVLEHVDDADAFVAELAPLAPRGTIALVSVPAWPSLFSSHDEALGHHRRYTRRGLHAQVAPWLDVLDQGSLFASLVPARAITVAVERFGRRSAASVGAGGWTGGTTATALANGALGLDARAGRALARVGVRLPGLSHWVVGVVR